MFGREKNLVYLLNNGKVVKRFKVRNDQDTLAWNGRKYNFDLANCSFKEKTANKIFLDLTTGQTWTFEKIMAGIAPEELEELYADRMVRLAVRETVSHTENWILMIALLGMGLAVGVIIGMIAL